MITHDELKRVLDYDPETGVFRWKQPRPKVRVGDIAGTTTSDYVKMCIDGKRYWAHRLAWLYVYGEWPERDLDHINGNGSDNRIDNLRQATKKQNMRNVKRHDDGCSGLKGVTYCGRRKSKWVAQINVDGFHKYLGRFSCPAAAHFAYCIAADRHFGEFARVA